MTSTQRSERQPGRAGVKAASAQETLLGSGSRLLCLAVGGFLIIRIALAILQLT
jgi:hypothetical protein